MARIKSLILRITEQCNLRCFYCYAGHNGCGHMNEETALRAVALCCPEGDSLRIQFTGGEPLLNFDLMEKIYFFGRATNRRLRLAVQTNGTLLTPEICKKLSTMKCAVGVSLDGLLESNQCRVFPDGTSSFTATAQGIRTLGEMGIRCNLTTVISSANAKNLGQLPDLALWLGNVSGVGLDLFRPLGMGATENLSPTEEDLSLGLSELVRKTIEIQNAGIPFRLREMERLKKQVACGGCGGIYCYAQTDKSLCIDKNGDCWPCSSLAGDKAYYLGNLRDGLPTVDRSLVSLNAPESCQNCASFPYCGGGCPAGRSAGDEERDRLTCFMHEVLFHEFGRFE
ncbi:MAG: radical SAM protein [Oscillospiraceae bacterium]|nr:radical SAM protein [Oscillospiraceae bacterium]